MCLKAENGDDLHTLHKINVAIDTFISKLCGENSAAQVNRWESNYTKSYTRMLLKSIMAICWSCVGSPNLYKDDLYVWRWPFRFRRWPFSWLCPHIISVWHQVIEFSHINWSSDNLLIFNNFIFLLYTQVRTLSLLDMHEGFTRLW